MPHEVDWLCECVCNVFVMTKLSNDQFTLAADAGLNFDWLVTGCLLC